MSIYAVEKALWDVCADPAKVSAFRADPSKLMAGYALSDEEGRMLREMDVRALTIHKVNPMLIMSTWNAVIGADKIGEYIGKLNATG